MSQVKAAIAWIKERSRDLVVAMKSTVPPGTGVSILERELSGSGIGYAANPEFLRAGQSVRDWECPDRIVIGASPNDQRSVATLRRMYADIDAPALVTDITTAEMIKYAGNAFLATRISFMNEIAAICDSLGASIDDVRDGLAMDSRSGGKIHPGVGYGGPCLPKDIGALERIASQSGAGSELLHAAISVNRRQWQLPLRRLRERFGGNLRGLKAGALGLTFKPGTDDVTEAPALRLVRALAEEGAELRVFDPAAKNLPAEILPPSVQVAPNVPAAAAQARAVLLLTEWSDIINADWPHVARVMASPRFLFDGRNALDPAAMKALGFEYVGVGRNSAYRTGQGENGA